jgi:hypothetical protein
MMTNSLRGSDVENESQRLLPPNSSSSIRKQGQGLG